MTDRKLTDDIKKAVEFGIARFAPIWQLDWNNIMAESRGMTDRELMQQALDLLDDINQCSLPPTGIPLPAEIDHVMEALRNRLEKWTVKDMAYRPGGLSQLEPKPAAWVRNLTDPQPHCVTDLRYMSAADTDAGVQYVPLYTAPKILCGCGDQIMPDDGAECGTCVTARNA